MSDTHTQVCKGIFMFMTHLIKMNHRPQITRCIHSLYTCPQKKGSFLICAPVGMSGSPEPAPFGTPVVSPVPLTCVGHLTWASPPPSRPQEYPKQKKRALATLQDLATCAPSFDNKHRFCAIFAPIFSVGKVQKVLDFQGEDSGEQDEVLKSEKRRDKRAPKG